MKNFFYRVFCGFFLGVSVFAPGVSGSVMAIMMGIYRNLLEIVANPFKNFRKNVIYLFPMGIGALISLIFFVLIFGYLFDTYEKATYLLFIGLMMGNLPVVFKEANTSDFKVRYLIGIMGAFLLAASVGIFSAGAGEKAASPLYLGMSGVITGAASMIPGMSISMLLMLFGIYNYLLDAAKSIISVFDFSHIMNIMVFGVFFAGGMVGFSNFTKLIFKRYHNFAYFMVFGFMCGCLVGIFYRLPSDAVGFNWFIGAAMLGIGLLISLLFVYLGKKFNTEEI